MNYFYNNYCINLPERSDRKDHAMKQFEKVGIKQMQWVVPEPDINPEISIFKTYLKVFEDAMRNKYPNFAVYEDDVLFLETDCKGFNQLPKDWELFYMGGNLHQQLNKYSSNLFELKEAYAMHAVAYKTNFIRMIFDSLVYICGQMPIDVAMAYFQHFHEAYINYPMVATQRNDTSDILKKPVNQGYLEERFYKFTEIK